MTLADLTKWVAYGHCQVVRIEAWNPQTFDIYLQLFQKPTVANGDVPEQKSLWIPAGAQTSFDNVNSIPLRELLIALSSTEANYTALTANQGVDMTIWVISNYLVTTNTTVAGDLTTSVASLAVWSNSAGPKRLLRLDITNNKGSDLWYLITDDNTALRYMDNQPNIYVPTGTTKTLWFGDRRVPVGIKNGTGPGGCKIFQVVAAAIGSTSDNTPASNIRAIYDV